MKRILLGTVFLAALVATPVAARDNSAYFGIEAGPMFALDSDVDIEGEDFFDVDHSLGVDGDLIAGYDFGIVRAEFEAAYKWARHKDYDFDGDSFDGDGHSRAYSFMGNVLLDLGQNESFNFYGGGGVGIAFTSGTFDDGDDRFVIKDSGLAWQGILGIRAPVFRHFDVGLKYRYFDAGKIRDSLDGDGIKTRFRSHSVLASLIYNFAELAPPPPPPMAPPPPPPPLATQTCPDGSVVLATDACPMAPPPPPPPPPAPERGL